MSTPPLKGLSKASTSLTQEAIPKRNEEMMSLDPTAVITMFEFDFTDILFAKNLISPNTPEGLRIFRIHNSVNLFSSTIQWQGHCYLACPCHAEGFEVSSKGALPKPKLGITSTDDSLPAFSAFRAQIKKLGDPSGATVTRIRTLAKFLDSSNFTDDTQPHGFESNEYAEFPRDVYYISRLARESKGEMQWELSTVLDFENLFLPKRRMWSRRCSFEYRGEGCCYEYSSGAPKIKHSYPPSEEEAHKGASLPGSAPPKANVLDEKFVDLLQGSLSNAGEFSINKPYRAKEFVYIEKGGIRYYFVRSVTGPEGIDVTNTNYWIPDQCSKTVRGCKLRWETEICNHNKGGALPFGGFPGLGRLT
jgi:lambda family phage minor tail protein L